MCDFFSFKFKNNQPFYNNFEQRKTVQEPDSHTNIKTNGFTNPILSDDRVDKYEYTPSGFIVDSKVDPDTLQEDAKAWAKGFIKTREFWKINLLEIILRGNGSLYLVPPERRDATERLLHLHACFSAEQCLEHFEKVFPGDVRPRAAIAGKRDWLDGKITDQQLEQLRRAAWESARSAAGAAAWAAGSAAWAADWAVYWAEHKASARATESTAWAAAWVARLATRSTSWSTTESAAEAAESTARSAQIEELERLMDKAWPIVS